jgi:hypothetical protein
MIGVSFTGGPVNENVNITGVSTVSIAENTKITVNVTGPFIKYYWYIDGEYKSSGASNSFEISGSHFSVLGPGTYELTVVCETLGGAHYSKQLTFQVVL